MCIGKNISGDRIMYEPEDFQLFRNNLHHKIIIEPKSKVILEILESKDIERYWDNGDYLKALYLLSVLDLFSDEENVPKVEEYAEYRNKALEEPFFVGDFLNGNKDDCIAEFRQHNIFEGDLYDAV